MLQLENISIRFGNNPEAVSDTSIHIARSERMAIIGETGSGKSVLLLAMLGLLPPSAKVTGRALLEGRDLLQMSDREMNHIRGERIAYIPQGSGNGLNPLYTVGHQMCETVQKQMRIGRREALARSIDFLDNFGFENSAALCRLYPFQLSGGMRQRVLIAMGIAAGADVVFADEPTKGLDRSRIAMVEEAFARLGERTLLCVTHDLRFARNIANRITVMYASQQIESCSREDFFSQPLHPYSRAMLMALPENGLRAEMGFAPPREDASAQLACRFINRCPYASERCGKMPPMIELGERKVRCWKYAD